MYYAFRVLSSTASIGLKTQFVRGSSFGEWLEGWKARRLGGKNARKSLLWLNSAESGLHFLSFIRKLRKN
jgi:hypothetical protein